MDSPRLEQAELVLEVLAPDLPVEVWCPMLGIEPDEYARILRRIRRRDVRSESVRYIQNPGLNTMRQRDVDEAVRLRSEGATLEAIATRIGVGRTTIHRVLRFREAA